MVKAIFNKQEYGDYQTPRELADKAVSIISNLPFTPKSVVEPTCGTGSFLLSAKEAFPNASHYLGVDISEEYLAILSKLMVNSPGIDRVQLEREDFFKADWASLLSDSLEPLLILGNPPWVTNSQLCSLGSKNLPDKVNIHNHRGMDALTGKSNFDISEWMILRYLDWLNSRRGTIGVLCKTSVARKILKYVWINRIPVCLSRMYIIDSRYYFDASVDSCFFILSKSGEYAIQDCQIFPSLSSNSPSQIIGFHDNMIVNNVPFYLRWQHLSGIDSTYKWRSGIKHDCSKVMEIKKNPNGTFYNDLGLSFDIEDKFVFPMLKSSDISNGQIVNGRKLMIVPQNRIGEDTNHIQTEAPKTWDYLKINQKYLDNRGSSIYRNRPRFSIFGVGDYSFSQWKVAISGFYKKLVFKVISPYDKKPVVFDDTIYFLPCADEEEAIFLASILNSKPSTEFYSSMIFWPDKRPITENILSRLNLRALSIELNQIDKYSYFASRHMKLYK